MAGDWPCLFCDLTDLDFVAVHKNAKKDVRQSPAIWTSRLLDHCTYSKMFTNQEKKDIRVLFVMMKELKKSPVSAVLCAFLRENFSGDRVKSKNRSTWWKNTFLIFRPEITYSESKNVVYFFCRNIFFFSRKFKKTATSGHRHKMTKLKETSKGTGSLLLKSAERT